MRAVSYTHLDVYKRQVLAHGRWRSPFGPIGEARRRPFARLRPSDVQNLRGRALWLGKPREKPTRKGADMGTALLWLAAGYALGAVSYTHLDVYKRQGRYRAGIGPVG